MKIIDSDADALRDTERERLRQLLTGDMEAARRLHAKDFQLISPFGSSFSREQYFGGIASGRMHHFVWEPESSDVRLYSSAAVTRYRPGLEIIVRGQRISRRPHRHTHSYEKRDGQWKVLWSHATEGK